MSLIKILIIGTNLPIMETIERLINREGIWLATIASSDEEALSFLKTDSFKMVLLCAGLDDEISLKETIENLNPKVPIIKHYGGGSGLLFAEIYQGLKTTEE